MSLPRRVVPLVITLLLLGVACTDPPEKEMNEAQGALNAAKAAGADMYATEEYEAASKSLRHAHEAVQQRDYRLALNDALDARERAENAAKSAADGKAAARSAAERGLHDAQTLLDQAQAKLTTADAAKPRRRVTSNTREQVQDAQGQLQKAREAIAHQDYLGAKKVVDDVQPPLKAAIEALNAPAPPPPAKRRK